MVAKKTNPVKNEPPNKRISTKAKQTAFLNAYVKNFGNISASLVAAGIKKNSSHIFYDNWKNDTEFMERFREAQKVMPAKSEEYLQDKLYQHIDNMSLTALIFALKAKAGWRDNYEIKQKTDDHKVEVVISYDKPDNDDDN